jgi:hypothetical protein
MAMTRNRGEGFNTSDGLYTARGVVTLDADGAVVTPLASGGSVLVLGTGINVAATATDAGAGTDDEAITGAAAGLRLMGFSAEETAAGTATVILHNGTGTGDAVTYTFSLAAGESRGEWFGPDGIASAAGIYLERVTGTTRVVVHHKAVA